jgi:hypothetical protein
VTEGRARKNAVTIPSRGAGGSLVDEIRAGIPVAATQPVAATAPTVTKGVAAPPPPRKRAPSREQFSTKLPPALIANLRDFAEHHDAEIQTVVELAITEYLTNRGWMTAKLDSR